ncbi:hypothetical protein HMPREF9946_04265 [Acetobacteraceae bacterium AT-5844]|nr:hypothetical protein HMPREF9946_04265 [Acetobacteraceae bacterium AT-5844]
MLQGPGSCLCWPGGYPWEGAERQRGLMGCCFHRDVIRWSSVCHACPIYAPGTRRAVDATA